MALRSTSKVSFAKTTLSYPLFAAEFDPYNRGFLVVGGGGGESKTGVPNQIVSRLADATPIEAKPDLLCSQSSTFPTARPLRPLSSSTSPVMRTLCSHSAVLRPEMA